MKAPLIIKLIIERTIDARTASHREVT